MWTTTLQQDHPRSAMLEASIDVLLDPRDGEAANLAAIHITVPPGAVMPPHHHGASEAVLFPLEGELVVLDAAGAERRIAPGSLTVVGAQEKVGVENRSAAPARVLVCFAPPSFIEAVRPRPAGDATA